MNSSSERAILFVCTGNTCRSLMAEYLARNRSDPTSALFESAGIKPGPSEDTYNAVETLRSRFGIDASAHVPRDLGHIDLSRFAVIVAIDDPKSSQIFQKLKTMGISTEVLVRWRIDDPYGDDLSAYERCALALLMSLHRLQDTHSIRRNPHRLGQMPSPHAGKRQSNS